MKKIFFWSAIYILSMIVLLSVTAPLIFPEGHVNQNVDHMLQSPDLTHWMGTDSLGRDLFARLFMGGRVSLMVGISSALLTSFIGILYGAVAGWREGKVDSVMMRFNDVLMAIPSFVSVSVICLSFKVLLPEEVFSGSSIIGMCIAISATHWMTIARVTRGQVIEIKRKPFIEAAIALGASPKHIVMKHLLPNMASTLLVLIALQVPSAIIYESFMSFIGLGTQPPDTSWGILVKEGWSTLSTYPHLILFPSLILFLTVWSIHLLIDHLRAPAS